MIIHVSNVTEHYFLRIDDIDGKTEDIWDFEVLIAQSMGGKEDVYYGKAFCSKKDIEIPWRLLKDESKSAHEEMYDKVKDLINKYEE